LFKSLNGILINADINGSYNIIRKVISKFKYEIKVVGLQPIKLNII
jgi:putative transposase